MQPEFQAAAKPPGVADCMPSSPDFFDTSMHVPSANTPTKTVRVNLVFLSNSMGQGGFAPGTEAMSLIDLALQQVNITYANLVDRNDPACGGGAFMADSKIQFCFTKTFVPNGYYWDNDNNIFAANPSACPMQTDWWLNPLDSLQVAGMSERHINIYFTEDGSDYAALAMGMNPGEPGRYPPCATIPTANKKQSLRIHFPDEHNKYLWIKNHVAGVGGNPSWPAWEAQYVDDLRAYLAHELGHCLGWFHYESCTDHVMRSASGGRHDFISRDQLGIAHRAMSVLSTREFVKDCGYDPNPIVIRDQRTWDFDMRLYQDVVVESGGHLTLRCRDEFVEDAGIRIERGARVTVDSAILTNACPDKLWAGIQVWGNPSLPHSGNASQHGRLVVRRGSLIENADVGVVTARRDAAGFIDPGFTNGWISVSGSRFRNNRKSIEFFGRPTLSANPNLSFVGDTAFVVDRHPLLENRLHDAFVTIFRGNSLQFVGNTFDNEMANLAFADRGDGIRAIGASFVVKGNCQSVPCVGRTVFRGLNHGVLVDNDQLYGETETTVVDAYFEGNRHGVFMRRSNGFRVLCSEFSIEDGLDGVSTGWPTGVTVELPTGPFRVADSDFYTLGNLAGTFNWGVLLAMTNSQVGYVLRNSFHFLGTANEFRGINQQLTVDCNSYDANGFDWKIDTLSTLNDQGALGAPRTNYFNPVPGAVHVANCSGAVFNYVSTLGTWPKNNFGVNNIYEDPGAPGSGCAPKGFESSKHLSPEQIRLMRQGRLGGG